MQWRCQWQSHRPTELSSWRTLWWRWWGQNNYPYLPGRTVHCRNPNIAAIRVRWENYQAIYADHRRYLNFNDGILTSIQESGAAP